jgi:hypothetical protein
MHGIRSCRKTNGEQQRRDQRSNAPVAERELFTMRAMIRTNSESAMRETQSIADQLIEDIVALLFHPPLGTSERLFSCTDTMIHSRRQHLCHRLGDGERPGEFVQRDGRQPGINNSWTG